MTAGNFARETTRISDHSFFVVSSMRSGSTGLSAILNSAKNCVCHNETMFLKTITWLKLNDLIFSPMVFLQNVFRPVIERTIRDHGNYGLKDPSLFPLISDLYEAFGSRFVYITRDGRDVVRSILNWNQVSSGLVYTECKEDESYQCRAIQRRNKLKETPFVYMTELIRPRNKVKGWEDLSRFEMYCYYWVWSNETIMDALDELPQDRVFRVKNSTPESANRVEKLLDWLGLETKIDVHKIMSSRFNSTEHLKLGTGTYKHWSEWPDDWTEKFWSIAGPTMRKLGYESTDYNEIQYAVG